MSPQDTPSQYTLLRPSLYADGDLPSFWWVWLVVATALTIWLAIAIIWGVLSFEDGSIEGNPIWFLLALAFMWWSVIGRGIRQRAVKRMQVELSQDLLRAGESATVRIYLRPGTKIPTMRVSVVSRERITGQESGNRDQPSDIVEIEGEWVLAPEEEGAVWQGAFTLPSELRPAYKFDSYQFGYGVRVTWLGTLMDELYLFSVVE